MRIRTIKPEFFLHEELAELEPIERIAFIGLWCASDREGRFEWRPKRLKHQILPYDNVDFSRVLDALTTRGFVQQYASDGVNFGVIPSFTKHQVINNRERDSDLPDPINSEVVTRAPRVTDACPTRYDLAQAEGKGREGNMEGKGREQNNVHDDERHARESVPYSVIVQMYHETLPTLPSVKLMTDSRKQAIRNRYNQFKGHEKGPLWPFEVVFNKTANSKFLIQDWGKCNFDWLMKQANFVKVVEGNYDNK